nr:MAG TPA: hypothetical protein [Bacteriophage sp.]
MANSEIILSGSLIIGIIGLLFTMTYFIFKLYQNKFSKYLEHFSISIMCLTFGFLSILIVLFLISLMTKITMILLGY